MSLTELDFLIVSNLHERDIVQIFEQIANDFNFVEF